MNKKIADVHVMVLPVDVPVTIGCITCRRLIFTATNGYLVGLKICGPDERTFSYFAGMDPLPVCCGSLKGVPFHAATEAVAQEEVERIRTHIRTHGTTEGLSLLKYVQPRMN